MSIENRKKRRKKIPVCIFKKTHGDFNCFLNFLSFFIKLLSKFYGVHCIFSVKIEIFFKYGVFVLLGGRARPYPFSFFDHLFPSTNCNRLGYYSTDVAQKQLKFSEEIYLENGKDGSCKKCNVFCCFCNRHVVALHVIIDLIVISAFYAVLFS